MTAQTHKQTKKRCKKIRETQHRETNNYVQEQQVHQMEQHADSDQ